MPLAAMRAAAADAAQLSRDMGESAPLSEVEALVVSMLDWFKRDFFTWVSCTCACGIAGPPKTLQSIQMHPSSARACKFVSCTVCAGFKFC